MNGLKCQSGCCSPKSNQTDYRQGLIVWGDPWEAKNWEVTEGFVRRWGWMMKGCWEGILEATNFWRGIRGEGPLGWVEDEEAWM